MPNTHPAPPLNYLSTWTIALALLAASPWEKLSVAEGGSPERRHRTTQQLQDWYGLNLVRPSPTKLPAKKTNSAGESKFEADRPLPKQIAEWYGISSANSTSNGLQPSRVGPQNPSFGARISKSLADRYDFEQLRPSKAEPRPDVPSQVGANQQVNDQVELAVDSTMAEEFSADLSTLKPLVDSDPSSCSSGDCGLCDSCNTPSPSFVFRGEALLWWTDGMDTPPLVTTSPIGTDQADAGVLGQPDTVILYGGDKVTDDVRAGGKYSVTAWVSPCLALEASYLNLGRESTKFFAASNGDPIIARPFLNIQNGQEQSGLTGFPATFAGSLNAVATTELDFVDLVVRKSVAEQCRVQVDVLLGYRYGQLEDDLRITDINQFVAFGAGAPTLSIVDDFSTRNEFHGFECGVVAGIQESCWTVEFLLKLSVGNTKSRITIDGSTTSTTGQNETNDVGGFLALLTNIGTFERDEFTIMPEIGLTLSRQLRCGWEASFGYTFLYWSQLARSGDQIDRNLNPSLFPPADLDGVPQPEFLFVSTDFWAQGLRFGIEKCW